MTDLDKLIAAVEAGTVGDDGFCPMFHRIGLCTDMMNAYHGSLDASLVLLGALLPGAVWWRDEKRRMWVGYGFSEACASDDMASRALLLAILKTYRETKKGGQE